jgi:ZIP family zinc transporter
LRHAEDDTVTAHHHPGAFGGSVGRPTQCLVGSASMREQGRSQAFILGTWLTCAALLTLAVVIGAGPLSAAAPETLSLPLAFAAGAVLASLADTLMPEAYEKGGPLVALSTTGGFVLSFVLATL